MTRPGSIVRFEMLYVVAIVLSAVATAMNWSDMIGTPDAQQVRQMLGPSFIPVITVFSFTLSLLLWYFTARSPSAIARWGVVILYAFGLLSSVWTLLKGNSVLDVAGWLEIVALAVTAVAIWFLFRPDTTAWFEPRS